MPSAFLAALSRVASPNHTCCVAGGWVGGAVGGLGVTGYSDVYRRAALGPCQLSPTGDASEV